MANAQVELDPVTVTTSVNSVQAFRTGRNILVIKGDEFSKLPVQSIDQLLRYLPGIEVQTRGAMGSQSDIVMRGGTLKQVLVILGGIRINDPNTGHFSAYISVAPSEIERIEVLKGASSAIYGSEAVVRLDPYYHQVICGKPEGRTEKNISVAGCHNQVLFV